MALMPSPCAIPVGMFAASKLTMEEPVKHFECGSLVPGCAWHTEAENSAEIVRRVAEHLRNTHGETLIRPEMVDRIKDRIVEAERAA